MPGDRRRTPALSERGRRVDRRSDSRAAIFAVAVAALASLATLLGPWQRRLSLACAKHRTSLRRTLLAATLGGLIAAVVALRPVVRQIHLRHDFTWYDLGWRGLHPTRSYHTLAAPAPDVEFLRRDARCSDDLIFFAPRGPATDRGAVILDADGELVYRQYGLRGDTQDFKVQTYKGRQHLTFWRGVENNGRKEGVWFMVSVVFGVAWPRIHGLASARLSDNVSQMDQSYALTKVAPGGEHTVGDMHEFVITQDDTALLTVYESVPADLSPIGGPKHGYLLDSIFQEIDIETGDVLFEWHAADHMPLEATLLGFRGCSQSAAHAYNGCGDHEYAPFDFFHLNSLHKDEAGNYLISGRSYSTLSYIDGKTGLVLWNLGGKLNEFADLSGGEATGFGWQHHARFHDNGTTISLFDNRVHGPGTSDRESRGLILEVDVPNRTARVRQAYTHPQELLSFSQGDVQVLEETGNVFVGWGRSAGFTEFSADGDVLCDARFGAAAFFSFGAVTSYRVFRGSWVGQPAERPHVVMAGRSLHVSWNGATEVAMWRVEGSLKDQSAEDLVDGSYETVAVVRRAGFETTLELPSDMPQYARVRMVALNAQGNALKASWPVDGPFRASWFCPLRVLTLSLGALLCSGAVLALVLTYFIRRRRRRAATRIRTGYRLVGEDDDDEVFRDHDFGMDSAHWTAAATGDGGHLSLDS